MGTIFAVIWQDFGTPLSLNVANSEEAIAKAQEMHAKARANKITLHDLRAVSLSANDKLETLWSAN